MKTKKKLKNFGGAIKMTREDIITYLNSAQGRSKRSIKQVDRNL